MRQRCLRHVLPRGWEMPATCIIHRQIIITIIRREEGDNTDRIFLSKQSVRCVRGPFFFFFFGFGFGILGVMSSDTKARKDEARITAVSPIPLPSLTYPSSAPTFRSGGRGAFDLDSHPPMTVITSRDGVSRHLFLFFLSFACFAIRLC